MREMAEYAVKVILENNVRKFIPGHVYEDRKGKRYLFLGYGNFVDKSKWLSKVICKNKFLVIEIDELKKAWENKEAGHISFTWMRSDPYKIVKIIRKSDMALLEDVGEMYSSNFSRRFKVVTENNELYQMVMEPGWYDKNSVRVIKRKENQLWQ